MRVEVRLPNFVAIHDRTSTTRGDGVLAVVGHAGASTALLTLSPPIPLWLYTLPHWSNPPFLISDIRALWRSVLSARAPGCQKLKKWWVRPVWR